MANVIRHKRGTSNPAAGDFSETAELLVNTTDGGLFTKTDGGSVVEIGGSDANKADVSHKYHEFGSGQYFYDNYEQGRYFRLFTENATFSVTRFRAFSNVEYYNTSTSSWTSWSGGVSGVEALLDGRQNTGMNVAHANRKFRFTVNVSSGWPTRAVYFLQSSWSAISYPGITVTLENATSASGTFTTKDTAVFTSSYTGSTWGIHARTTSNLHNGATYVRVTIDITDWTDSNNYTTVPLRNFEILSNYSGSDLLPFSWDYNQNITVSGTVDGRDVAADGTKLDGIESGATADQTASEILTAIKTVDGSGSGLDADTVDGIQSTGIVYGTAGAAVNALSTTQNVYELGQYKAGFWDINGASWTPNTGWWWGATFAHRSNTGSYNYSGQLAFENGNGGNGIYARTISNGTASSWSKLWSDGNDGSGSGLDADTLDGQQGSYYAPIANPTFTGTVTYDALASSSSLARHYSTYYSGTSYLVDGEYQKVVTIIPNGSSQNYQIIGRMIAQSGGTAQTINFNALLRSNTLPDLSWTISYTEELMGAGQYITPQLWTKETTTAGFVLAFEVNATIYGNVTCEFLVIPRSSSQHSNVTVNTDSTSEQSSVDAGYTARDFTLNTSLNGVNITYNGNISFEGSTADAYETTLTAADPTADRTITLPNATGTVWTSGNDGSGSGLDADTVDGVHASSFFQANNALSATTGAFSGDVTMSGTGALKVANGTTAQRPTAATGQIRYNTTLGAIESYVQGAWQVIANTALDYGLITSASDTTFDYGALS